ncbi:6-phosphofructokinase [Nanoarchaeota archaeon]
MKNNIIAIGQGGGPTSVINDQVAGALYMAKKYKLKIYGLVNGMEGLLNMHVPGNIIDITHWDPKHVRQRPGAVLGTTRIKLDRIKDRDKIITIKNNIVKLGIDNIVYFGGDDSSAVLHALGIGVHGSKTVDNDLMWCHHTPGFGSAALFNAIAIKNLALDIGSYSLRGNINNKDYYIAPVTVYQVMGRETGWLTLASAFAKVDKNGIINPKLPPDIIWPAETDFDKELYLNTLEDILIKKGQAVVVVSEGLSQTIDGKRVPIAKVNRKDPNGHLEYGRVGLSAAEYVATVSREIVIKDVAISSVNIKETAITPQHIQRCYVKSKIDSIEAYNVGKETVKAILDKDDQVSIVLKKYKNKIKTARVPLLRIAGKTRYLPEKYRQSISEPSQEFIDEYLRTIGGPKVLPHYDDIDYSKHMVGLRCYGPGMWC